MPEYLDEDGVFTPVHVVANTAKYEQLLASMGEEPKVIPGLVAMFRNRKAVRPIPKPTLTEDKADE